MVFFSVSLLFSNWQWLSDIPSYSRSAADSSADEQILTMVMVCLFTYLFTREKKYDVTLCFLQWCQGERLCLSPCMCVCACVCHLKKCPACSSLAPVYVGMNLPVAPCRAVNAATCSPSCLCSALTRHRKWRRGKTGLRASPLLLVPLSSSSSSSSTDVSPFCQSTARVECLIIDGPRRVAVCVGPANSGWRHILFTY